MLYVEEDRGLMEVAQVGHVFHPLHTGLVHGQDVVGGEGATREGEVLQRDRVT